jgi:hypothetical protein
MSHRSQLGAAALDIEFPAAAVAERGSFFQHMRLWAANSAKQASAAAVSGLIAPVLEKHPSRDTQLPRDRRAIESVSRSRYQNFTLKEAFKFSIGNIFRFLPEVSINHLSAPINPMTTSITSALSSW